MKLVDIDVSTKDGWEKVQAILSKLLNAFDTPINRNAEKFIKWVPVSSIDNIDRNTVSIPNCYIFQDEDTKRSVGLKFGSIHSVKGRTHLATLVLETYSKAHNIKAILRWLCGQPPKSAGTQANRLKCQYVAMTRTKGLLCIAMPVEFVDGSSKQALQEIGWNIKVID